MDSVQFLDAVRARHRLPSDRKLAAFLGIDQPRVVAYRKGRRKLDPDACLAIARALELPAEHVFASIAAERAKRSEHRRVWERLAKLAKNAHVVAAVGLLSSTSIAPPYHAAEAAAEQCILCKKRRWAVPLPLAA